MARIAVALSGGGYRAALFGLGALLYLADARKNREVVCISSVSGGSLTNGVLAQAKGFHTRSSSDVWGMAQPLAWTIAYRTLWATAGTWLYLVALLVTLLSIAYLSFWIVPGLWWLRLLLFLLLLLPWGWLLQLRGIVAGRAFGTRLFSPDGSPILLADVEAGIDHVICATHLNAGEHFYFSGRFVYSYRFGWGKPSDLPLHAAVQASAAFPGGFPPRWMRTGRFGFQGAKKGPPRPPRLATLADGGVYDNMGDQWPRGVSRRARSEFAPTGLKIPDLLIAVNASADLDWSAVRTLHVPFYGELLALKRDVAVMYDNSASLRRQALFREFQRQGDLDGAMVNIEQTPFKIPRAFAGEQGPERLRAKAVLEKLGDTEEEWQRITDSNVRVRTTLSRLGPDAAARLIYHGYVLAMANLHTILDFPLLDVPDRSRFVALLNGRIADV